MDDKGPPLCSLCSGPPYSLACIPPAAIDFWPFPQEQREAAKCYLLGPPGSETLAPPPLPTSPPRGGCPPGHPGKGKAGELLFNQPGSLQEIQGGDPGLQRGRGDHSDPTISPTLEQLEAGPREAHPLHRRPYGSPQGRGLRPRWQHAVGYHSGKQAWPCSCRPCDPGVPRSSRPPFPHLYHTDDKITCLSRLLLK